MSKIEIGRFSQRLRRSLGMKGQEMVASELSPEISPVIIVEDNDPEQQFLQQVRLAVSSMLQGATLAENTVFRLRNPAGSGVVATLTSLAFSSDVPCQFNFGYSTTLTDLAKGGATGLRDQRWGAPANPTALVASRANNVAISLTSGLWIVRALADTTIRYPLDPVVLLPGETLMFGTDPTTNVLVAVSLNWTERQFPELER